MPRDVIMPALGMAQDTGLIVAWHKNAGDAVAVGDVLFEVETDKATMEVEADTEGFLGGICAKAGEAVPVGNVIAIIAKTRDEAQSTSREADPQTAPQTTNADETLPDGHKVIMPVLGMAQDSGVLVNWLKSVGEKVSEEDPLFEVETDKSTMEVAAGANGFLAATLAIASENIPTGEVIAIISDTKPENIVARAFKVERSSVQDAPSISEPAPAAIAPKKSHAEKPVKAKPTKPSRQGRLLASPKARRLALERGINLEDLRVQGLPEPFHALDIEGFTPEIGTSAAMLNLSVNAARFYEFFTTLQKQNSAIELDQILAYFAGCALAEDTPIISVINGEDVQIYQLHSRGFDSIEPLDDGTASLQIIKNGGEAQSHHPMLMLIPRGHYMDIYLQYRSSHLVHDTAFQLLSNFAGRIEEPLRHLL